GRGNKFLKGTLPPLIPLRNDLSSEPVDTRQKKMLLFAVNFASRQRYQTFKICLIEDSKQP
ncbi:hypothetical protein ACFLYR_07520, partial [Chloroflexota bacterium]